MRSNSWTVERIALLRRLWAEGETAVAIGVRLGGVSRSAVLGKVFRLRLRTEANARAAPGKQDAADNSRSKKAAAPARRRRGKREPMLPCPPPTNSRRRTLLELTNNTCRWPYSRGTGKFFFCGAPEADLARGIPYCARHMRRAYTADAGLAHSPPIAPALALSQRT